MLINILSELLRGTVVTLEVTAIALPMGFLMGLLLALLRVYGGGLLSSIAAICSTLLRAVPAVVLLFILYFVMAGAINLSPFLAGSLSLGIVSSGYQCEILRGAIKSVHSGQMVAARALGMTRIQAIRYIVMPQALRLAIPPWSNEAAIVLKDSSLVYALGVPEMLRRAQYIIARTYRPFLVFGICAVIYFSLTWLTNRGLDVIERRLRIPE